MVDLFKSRAIDKFREYIRIETVQPNPDYASAVDFFRNYAKELDLGFRTVEVVKDKPIILLALKGSDATSPSILLNSHMDVVPVFEEHWTHPPFSAFMDENGEIYGRGSQDMKCVTIQYLEALRLLKKEAFVPKRNIFITIVPDEEVGGKDGMEKFVQTKDFEELKVGFAMDEGLASETEVYRIYNAERKVYWVEIRCRGNPGHGSLLIENTAAEKMRKIVNVFLDFRDQCVQEVKDKNLPLGQTTTCNLTVLQGGVQTNVVPTEFKIVFDFRVRPDQDGKKMIQALVEKAAVEVELVYQQEASSKVLITDTSSPFFHGVFDVFRRKSLKYEVDAFPGGTDARFLRSLDIPAMGFSPMVNTKVLLHDHDERLHRQVFLDGILLYKDLIRAVAQC